MNSLILRRSFVNFNIAHKKPQRAFLEFTTVHQTAASASINRSGSQILTTSNPFSDFDPNDVRAQINLSEIGKSDSKLLGLPSSGFLFFESDSIQYLPVTRCSKNKLKERIRNFTSQNENEEAEWKRIKFSRSTKLEYDTDTDVFAEFYDYLMQSKSKEEQKLVKRIQETQLKKNKAWSHQIFDALNDHDSKKSLISKENKIGGYVRMQHNSREDEGLDPNTDQALLQYNTCDGDVSWFVSDDAKKRLDFSEMKFLFQR